MSWLSKLAMSPLSPRKAAVMSPLMPLSINSRKREAASEPGPGGHEDDHDEIFENQIPALKKRKNQLTYGKNRGMARKHAGDQHDGETQRNSSREPESGGGGEREMQVGGDGVEVEVHREDALLEAEGLDASANAGDDRAPDTTLAENEDEDDVDDNIVVARDSSDADAGDDTAQAKEDCDRNDSSADAGDDTALGEEEHDADDSNHGADESSVNPVEDGPQPEEIKYSITEYIDYDPISKNILIVWDSAWLTAKERRRVKSTVAATLYTKQGETRADTRHYVAFRPTWEPVAWLDGEGLGESVRSWLKERT